MMLTLSPLAVATVFNRSAATPAPAITPPAKDWRVPIAAVTDSANDAGTIARLLASSTEKTLPFSVVGASTTRTYRLSIGSIAAPGGFVYFRALPFGGSTPPTVVAYESFDSTNGTDGNWNAVSYADLKPTAAATTLSRPQMIPLAAGAARWIRLEISSAASITSNIFGPGVFQWPASGNPDAWLSIGASHDEGVVWGLRGEIQRLWPDRDPVVFDYATAGANNAQMQANLADGLAALPQVPFVIVPATGNSSPLPFSSQIQSTKDDYTTRYTAMIAAIEAAGKIVFPTRLTYRQNPYASGVVGTTNQQNGTKPWNESIIDPAVLANDPDNYHTGLGTAAIDHYGSTLFSRQGLDADGNHGNHRTDKLATILWAGARVYGETPLHFAEWAVARAELEQIAWYKDKATEVLDGLPASAARTALVARLAAITGTGSSRRININFATSVADSGRTENWNNAATSGATNALIDAGGNATGKSVMVQGGFTTGTGAATITGEMQDLPDSVMGSYIFIQGGPLTITLGGLDDAKTYDVYLTGSRAVNTSDRYGKVTVNGKVQSFNAASNPQLHSPLSAATFRGLAPSAGALVLSIGGYTASEYAYVAGIVLTERA